MNYRPVLVLLALSSALSACPRPTVVKGDVSYVKVKVDTGRGPVTFLQEALAAQAGTPVVEGIYRKMDVLRMDGIERIFDNILLPVRVDDAALPENLRLPARFRQSVQLTAFGVEGLSGCTVTHVGRGVAITAGHCFLDRSPAIQTNLTCEGRSVQWGILYEPGQSINSVPPAGTSQCLRVDVAEWTGARDYAILHVSSAPSAEVEIDYSRPGRDVELTIYGYPQRRPLEWSGPCRLLGVEAAGTQFSHRCSTEPGNSGSAVLRTDIAPFRVVGIHDGGYATGAPLPGKMTGGSTVGHNYATYIVDTPLRRILDETFPSIQTSVRSSQVRSTGIPERARIHAGTVTDARGKAPITATDCALTDTKVEADPCVVECWEWDGKGKNRTDVKGVLSEGDCREQALAQCKSLGRSYCGYNYEHR